MHPIPQEEAYGPLFPRTCCLSQSGSHSTLRPTPGGFSSTPCSKGEGMSRETPRETEEESWLGTRGPGLGVRQILRRGPTGPQEKAHSRQTPLDRLAQWEATALSLGRTTSSQPNLQAQEAAIFPADHRLMFVNEKKESRVAAGNRIKFLLCITLKSVSTRGC